MLFLLTVLIAVAAILIWRVAAKKLAERNLAFRGIANLAGVAAVVFALLAIFQCFTIIPAGYVGVVDFFGVVSDKTLPPGVNAVNPMALIHKFSWQTQEHKENMQVLSREGLTIGLEISVLYRLNPDTAGRV